MKRLTYKLDAIAAHVFQEVPQAESLYLFGSRRHRTRSERSDIDLLLKHSGHVKQSMVRECIEDCPPVDIFLVEEARAVSVVNDSFIECDNFDSLVDELSAIKIWDRQSGKVDADVDWEMTVRADVVFTKTVLPDIFVDGRNGFLDVSLVKDTRDYIEKITGQINACYKIEAWDACAVLCRRLAELLIIEVYEHMGISSQIKDNNNNYLMLDSLIGKIDSLTPDVGRNVKNGLRKIKEVGDRSAHGRWFCAKISDVESLRTPMRDVVSCLVGLSGVMSPTT